jgi:hypothetical protein
MPKNPTSAVSATTAGMLPVPNNRPSPISQ